MRVRLFAWVLLAAVAVATSATHAVRPSPASDGILPLLVPVHADGAVSSQQWAVPSAVPGAPTNLTQSVVGSTVTLNWTAPATGGAATSFIVEASTTAGGPAAVSLPLTVPTLTVPNVPNGVYFVRVRGVNGEGAGPTSNEVTVIVGPPPCSQPPNPPLNLVGSPPGPSAILTWSPPVGGCPHTSFTVYAGTASGQRTVPIPMGLNLVLAGAAPPGIYFVSVVAENAFGSSAPSNEVRVEITGCTTPGAPVGFNSNVAGNTVSLNWGAPNTGGAAASYLLEAGISSGTTVVTFPLTANTFSLPGVPDGRYFVRIRAINTCGQMGPPSNERVLVVPGCGPPPGPPSTPTAVVTGAVAAISWSPVNGAVRYQLNVGTAMGQSNVTSQVVTGTSHPLAGLPAGNYFMRVVAIDRCDNSGPPSGEGTFTAVSAVPDSVVVNGPTALLVGENRQLMAFATFPGGTTLDVSATALWDSSSDQVATVGPGGFVSALAEGTATISATLQTRTGTLNLQVSRPPIADFFVDTNDDTKPLVKEGECQVRRRADGEPNVLLCRFDGRVSTPPGASFEWEIPVSVPGPSNALVDGSTLELRCGTFGPVDDPDVAEVVVYPVQLRVTVGGVSDVETKDITFIKFGAC